MFDSLKKKLRGFLSKAKDEVKLEEVPEELRSEPEKEEPKPETEPEQEEPVEVPTPESSKEEVKEPGPDKAEFVEEPTHEPEHELLQEEIPELPKEEKPLKEKKKISVEEDAGRSSTYSEASLHHEILKEVEEELKEEEKEPEPPEEEKKLELPKGKKEPEPEKKPSFIKKLFRKKPKEEPKPESGIVKKPALEKIKEKKKPSFVSKIIKKKRISSENLDNILWELELTLLENDIAKEVTEAITHEVKEKLLNAEFSGSVEEEIMKTLKESLNDILSQKQINLIQLIKDKQEKPFVIAFIGFNGSGKTMTIGKFAKLLMDNGLSVVFAAGDTFRAAAIEQLAIHAKNLNVPIIKQDRGSDSAAVIYDAIEHAKSKGIDVVLADTAGRSHTNLNLMDELKKVVRVAKPDLKIFVGDALTGNDAADQAKNFNDIVGIDCSVLTKIDCDAKGGSCISIAHMTQAPILYMGTGQDYGDMEEFTPEWFLEKVF